ncbi:MAG: HAMP domain-containing sensor histidine kinase [Luteolibacter sp.]
MKLLDRSIRSLLLYASAVILITIPALYFVVQEIVREEVLESLVAKKNTISRQFIAQGKRLDTAVMFSLDPDVQIGAAVPAPASDTFYRIQLYDSNSREYIPFQVLETGIMVAGKTYPARLKNSLVDSYELIESIVTIAAGLLIVVITGLVWINRYISHRIWKPFYQTLDLLKRFRVDQSGPVQLNASAIDEFNSLNETVEGLIVNNRKLYHTQKEFTENASHELQTPLAIISGNLELLLASQPLSRQQAELIDSMQQAVDRMSRLNKTLILLSRIDNHHFPQNEKLEVIPLVESTRQLYQETLYQKQVDWHWRISGSVTLTANRDLMEILIGNLISNAIRHNREQGLIVVTVTGSRLSICNSGPRESLDPKLLFRRFQKQGTTHESPGLGLAIVKQICEINRIGISYEFRDRLHCFSLFFPATG